VLALIALVAGLLAVFLGKRQRKEYEENAMYESEADKARGVRIRGIAGLVVAIVLAVAAVVLYILTQSMFNADMVWFDKYTVIFVIIAILGVVAMRFALATYKPESYNDGDNNGNGGGGAIGYGGYSGNGNGYSGYGYSGYDGSGNTYNGYSGYSGYNGYGG
jgi:uncharacterized membrane protein YgcG